MRTYVFDIETGPLPEELLIMPNFDDPEEVKIGNLKDPEKIAAKRAEHKNRFLEKAALSALSGQILALGILGPTKDDLLILMDEEPVIIEKFFELFTGDGKTLARWIGFNCASFDLPFIVRRAWAHSIAVPPGLFKGRYLSGWFIDLLEVWRCSAAERELVSLDRLSRFLGLAGKEGTGAAFAALLYQDPKMAIEYLKHDLQLSWAVAERFDVLGAAAGQFERGPARIQTPEPVPAVTEPATSELAFW